MASTWVEKQHIFIKYNPKAWNKSGANLGRRILCLQKSGANIAKMAFFEVFANFDIFKDKKIPLWALQWPKSARTSWYKYYRSHLCQKISFHNFSPNPALTAHCGALGGALAENPSVGAWLCPLCKHDDSRKHIFGCCIPWTLGRDPLWKKEQGLNNV